MRFERFVKTDTALFGACCGLFAAAVWGAWAAVTKHAVQHALDPYDITAIRFATAAAVLLPHFLRRRLATLRWPQALLLAVCAGAPYVIVASAGFIFAPASHGGMILPSSLLLFSLIGGAVLLREPLTISRTAGITAVISGLFLIGWSGFSDHGQLVWLGHLLFVLAGLLWCIYTLASRAWSISALDATAIVSVFSAVFYLPAYAAMDHRSLLAAAPSEILLQALFQGVLTAVIALICYTKCVKVLGAATGSLFAAMVPAFALLFAIPLLGESPNAQDIAGMVLVISGMLVALNAVGPLMALLRRDHRPS